MSAGSQMANSTRLVPAVASAIRSFRKSSDMSQEELALRAGLDRTYVSGVERGVRNITLSSLEQIIHALGVTPRVFFETIAELMSSSGEDSVKR